MPTRREFLEKSSVVAAALTAPEIFGQTAENTKMAEGDHSTSNPGQTNAGIVALNPNSNMPPADGPWKRAAALVQL